MSALRRGGLTLTVNGPPSKIDAKKVEGQANAAANMSEKVRVLGKKSLGKGKKNNPYTARGIRAILKMRDR